MPDLNLGVSSRQAIGGAYAVSKNASHQAEAISKGVLRLPPHPEWRGDLFDWSSDPFSDRNWRFQRHTLRWTMPLVHLGSESRFYAKLFVRVVRSWIQQNPLNMPSAPETWTDMATGTRALTLALGARLLKPADLEWYTDTLWFHLDHLMDERNLGRGNHALHQHQGLFVLSSLLRDEQGASLAISRMKEQFQHAFDDQGMNDEGSSAYHQMNIIWWKLAWERIALEGRTVPDDVRMRLDEAVDTLAHLTMPSGTLVHIGDGAKTEVNESLGPETKWISSRGAQGRPPNETLKVLDRGYILSRTTWMEDSTFLAMRFGDAMGYSHAHEDRGAIWIASDGVTWLDDSGFSSYQTRDPLVTYLRSPQAHNTSFIREIPFNGLGEVRVGGIQDFQEYRSFELLDNRYPPCEVRRQVLHFIAPDIILVVDKAYAGGSEAITLGQHWVLGSSIKARYSDRGFVAIDGNKSALLQWLGRRTRSRLIPPSEDGMLGWVYPRWKTAVESPRIEATVKGVKPTLAMLFARNAPDHLGIVNSYLDTKGNIRLTVMRGAKVWNIQIADSISIEEVQQRSRR